MRDGSLDRQPHERAATILAAMSVDVELAAKFRAGVPKSLFQARGLASIAAALRASVARDGKRFLLVTTGETTESPLTVLLNWTSALKK